MPQAQGQSNQFRARLASDTAWTNAILKAAPGKGLCLFVTDIVVNGGATATTFSLLDGPGGLVLYRVRVAANDVRRVRLTTPLKFSIDRPCALTSSGASVGAFVGVNGFVARWAGADIEPYRNVWYDRSGNGNSGTLVGWTWVDGDHWEANPPCLECAGVNNTQRVECAGGGPTGDFSVDSWAWVDNVPDNYGLLIGRNLGGPAGWGLYCDQTYVFAFLTTTDYSDRIQSTVVSGSVFTGAWHHFGASFDRDGYLRVYYDGAYVRQTDISSKAALDLSAKHPWLFSYGWTTQGKLAATREYNTVLSDADFAQNYAAGPYGDGYVRTGLVLDLNAATP